MSKEHDPNQIQEKINAGLTREQAIEVLDRQAAHAAPFAAKEKRTSRNTPGSSGTSAISTGDK
jgi:hypothetical protein